MSELKPCPFCEALLEYVTCMPGGERLRHPWDDDVCVLSGLEFNADRLPDWNRRTSAEGKGDGK
jgi:hypothetical protein